VKGTFKPGSYTIFSHAPFLPTSVAFKDVSFLLPIFWCPQKGQRSKVFKMLYYSMGKYIEQSPNVL
jgi:hypothetical protein